MKKIYLLPFVIASLLIVNATIVSASLIAECGDRNYLSNTVNYIIEGTVEKVESEGSFTYTDLRINNYVRGTPFTEDKFQIVTLGGTGLWVEDQPIFYEGEEVRIYLQEIDGKFSIMCGERGVEEISGNLSYRIYDGCNMEGEEGTPVSESIDLSQVGSSINIEQIVQIPYCNPQKYFKIRYSKSDKNIEIRELFDTNLIESECTIPVCSVYLWGKIDNIEKGNYTLTFVFEDKNSNQTKILAEKEFELGEGTVPIDNSVQEEREEADKENLSPYSNSNNSLLLVVSGMLILIIIAIVLVKKYKK